MSSERLPQDADLVDEFDRLLRLHASEVRDHTQAHHAKLQERGIDTMRGTGWAVRPFLLPARRLDFIATAFHFALSTLRNTMREFALRGEPIEGLLPFRREFDKAVDVLDGVWSSAFLSHFRPDGFLFEDRFVLSEINYGNGILVSCAYLELVADYWVEHPVIRRLHWDVERFQRRPLPWLGNIVRRFARPVEKPRIALLAHSEEWAQLLTFPKRTIDQIHLARDVFERMGMRPRFVTEKDLVLREADRLCFEDDGEDVDLVMFVTVGTTFLDRPELLEPGGPLAYLGKARVGTTWILKPLAGLLVDKGALPLLTKIFGVPTMADGFQFEIAKTEFPYLTTPSRFEDKDNWVIKRAFDGKDTHVGLTHSDAQWNAISGRACKFSDYVAQRYVSMPKAEVPVFVDEEHLEWIPSRVELSSFFYDGAYGGAGVRHAPDAEGIIMTDFPKDYGYSNAFTS